MGLYKTDKKRSRIILFTYLILALIGSPAISAAEAFYFEYSNNDSLSSGRYISATDTIDWLATGVLTLKKARDYSNSLLRNRLLRVFTLAGTTAIVIHLAGAYLNIKNDNIPIIKNLVPLKLRI